jgi:ring-1,2-phenylacetyl-CoA epoxidase subunit PaaE
MMFSLFKKKKEVENPTDNYLSLKIRQIVQETPDTVSIFFEQPDPFLEYAPGQFLSVIIEINGKEQRRSYSLCTSPFVDPYPAITVKRVKDGLVSNYLNDQLRPGKSLTVLKPMGNFTIPFHSQHQIHYQMVAGGSGITPLMAILKSILINEPLSRVSLVYCSRSEDQIIFQKDLELLQSKYATQLQVVYNLSQPTAGWVGSRGRLDAEKIGNLLNTNFYPEAKENKFLICGPEGLMNSALEVFASKGVSEDQVIKESFYVNLEAKESAMKAEGKMAPAMARDVEVTLNGESFVFEVAPEKTILESGLELNIDLPYSCQSGLCTACRGKLTSGKVDMIEDAGLSKGEIEAGYILCCSAKPASENVKITIE